VNVTSRCVKRGHRDLTVTPLILGNSDLHGPKWARVPSCIRVKTEERIRTLTEM